MAVVAFWSLVVVVRLLFVGCWRLRCSLRVGRCLLCVDGFFSLLIVCCLSCIVCCLWFVVVCWRLFGVRRFRSSLYRSFLVELRCSLVVAHCFVVVFVD